MATIIDELIVLLRLDGASSFEKGQKQTQEALDKSKKKATESGKEMESRAKRGSEAYAKFRGEVLALFTAFTAGVGLKDFVADTIKSEANLGRMSHALDLSVENLSAWQGVLKRNGGTAEDATSAFRSLADIMAEVQTTGTTAKGGILARMGIQASDLKDPQNAIIKMAETARSMDPVIASSLLRQVGFSEAMTNAMLLGGAALQTQLEAQRKLGVTTKADAEAAIKLQNALEGLKTASARVGAEILTSLEPVINIIAKGLSWLAEWAQRNQPIVMGLFLGLTTAVIGLGVAFAAATVEIWGPVAVIAAVGAALGALYEIITRGGHAFMEFMRSNKATSAAMAGVSEAASEVWQAIVAMVAPLRPVFDWIGSAFHAVSRAISDAFGAANMAVARGFISFLVGGLDMVANALRAVAALLRGDFKGALDAARSIKPQVQKPQVPAAQPHDAPAAALPHQVTSGNAPAATRPHQVTPGGVIGGALSIIRHFEGFLASARWDRNAYRAGFGSDTKTDPRTGEVSRITATSTVTREEAEADLKRRVSELMERVASSVGSAWNGFSSSAKDALTSMAYNYGSLPPDVLAAARRGDVAAVHAAVVRHQNDNGGINRERRLKEAAAIVPILSGATPTQGPQGAANTNIPPISVALGSQAQAANHNVSTTSTTTVQIDAIHVNAPNARDGDGVAAALAPALQRRMGYVGQVAAGVG